MPSHVPIEAKERVARTYRDKLRPGQPRNDPMYAAMIESMDESAGRILETLDMPPLSEVKMPTPNPKYEHAAEVIERS